MIIKKGWRSVGYAFRFGSGHADGDGLGDGPGYADGFGDGYADADPDDDWYYTMRQYYQ